jgi:hypothetical protein
MTLARLTESLLERLGYWLARMSDRRERRLRRRIRKAKARVHR